MPREEARIAPESTPEPSDDPDDLRRAAAGDRGAMDAVVDRHAPAVHRFLLRLTADPDRAEDALQETFIAAWRGAATFRGEGSARPWLLTIARNAVRRQHRRRAGEPDRHEDLSVLAVEAGWGDDGPGIDDRLAVRDLVERGLAALSPDDREILLLRDAEGLDGQEAADALGIGLAAQKSRLHRARLRFMAALENLDQETSHGG